MNEANKNFVSLHPLLIDYIKWKEEHDGGYLYDEIEEFFADYSRADKQGFMEWVLLKCCTS